MDKNLIEKRLQALEDQEKQTQGSLEQHSKLLAVIDGAKQDCKYWLSVLAEQAAAVSAADVEAITQVAVQTLETEGSIADSVAAGDSPGN